MKRKIMTVMLSALLAFCALGATGCNNLFIDGGEEIDPTKTQLYVSNYNGDVGTDWLYEVEERFEKLYENTSFEEGKTGVQVLVNPHKFMRADLERELEGASLDDVYFAEHAFYASWADKGLLLDISDIVKEDLSEFGESGTIEDKLSDAKKNMLTSTHYDITNRKGDGKYYGLPHYEGFQGVSYNVKIFDAYELYYNTDGKIIGATDTANKTKSAGPDGVLGNGDDGLPASLEQFARLCGYMESINIKPFIWTGMYNEYFNILLDSLLTSILGKEATEVLYSFNENAEEGEEIISRVITGFNGDTPVVGTAKINETTGYLLWQREEIYYVLDFAKKIYENVWYASNSVNGSFDHQMAQEEFVNGNYSSPKVAMLIDGNYWEKAAEEAITRSERDHNYNYEKDTDFAWMPLPTTVKGTEGDGNMTLKDATQAYAFIHAKVPESRKELAKKFLKFCYTEAELKNFTLSTGMTRDVEYTLTDSEVSKLGKYAQSIIAHKKTADIVNTASACTVYQANEEILTNTFWRTQVDTTYDRPHIAFHIGKVSAKDFFLGLGKLHTRNS